jgi:hypothetical protein
MGFSSFKSYGSQVAILKIIDLKINDYNFMNPLTTKSFTDISVLPSWTVDQPGIIISRASSPFYPSSNTNLPSGYTGDFEQTLSMFGLGYNKLVNISQQLFMTPGNYKLSFWASGRADGYVTSNIFSIYLGDTLLVENVSLSTANWTNYTYTYNALSSGNVTLRIFLQNPSGVDSTINFANFVII